MGYVLPMQEGASDALYDFFTGFDEAQFNRLDQQIDGLSKFTGNTLVLLGAGDKVLTAAQIPRLQEVMGIDQENVRIYADNAHFFA